MNIVENKLEYIEYCALRESVGWNNFIEEQVLQALENTTYTIVIYEDEKVIGMGRLLGDGMYYTIVDVVVHPAYQRRGIGHQVMHRMIEYVNKKTPKGWKSSIQLIAEQGKESFYKKLGFHILPNQGAGSGMQKLIIK